MYRNRLSAWVLLCSFVVLSQAPPASAQKRLTKADIISELATSGSSAQFGGDSIFHPIAPDFFGPGSLPFEGVVFLTNAELYPGRDLIYQIGGDSPITIEPGQSQSVPIEIVALNLKSIEPIQVQFADGSSLPFDLFITLDTSPSALPSLGHIQVTLDDGRLDGGQLCCAVIDVSVSVDAAPAGQSEQRSMFHLQKANGELGSLESGVSWAMVHDFVSTPLGDEWLIPGADPLDPSASLQPTRFLGDGWELSMVTIAVVPEPASMLLLLAGGCLALLRHSRSSYRLS